MLGGAGLSTQVEKYPGVCCLVRITAASPGHGALLVQRCAALRCRKVLSFLRVKELPVTPEIPRTQPLEIIL